MSVQYVHLTPEETPPSLARSPFCAVVIAEVEATEDWRERITEWLVKSGCVFAVTWGRDCEKWHDSVDGANFREFDYGDIPDDRFVMTTWHETSQLRKPSGSRGNVPFTLPSR